MGISLESCECEMSHQWLDRDTVKVRFGTIARTTDLMPLILDCLVEFNFVCENLLIADHYSNISYLRMLIFVFYYIQFCGN